MIQSLLASGNPLFRGGDTCMQLQYPCSKNFVYKVYPCHPPFQSCYMVQHPFVKVAIKCMAVNDGILSQKLCIMPRKA